MRVTDIIGIFRELLNQLMLSNKSITNEKK